MVKSPPNDILKYDRMVISKEVEKAPATPANIVLAGDIESR